MRGQKRSLSETSQTDAPPRVDVRRSFIRKEARNRGRHIRACLGERDDACIPTILVVGLSTQYYKEQTELYKYIAKKRIFLSVDSRISEFLSSGRDFVDRGHIIPESWMPLDVLQSLKARHEALDRFEVGSIEFGLAEQVLIGNDFTNKTGLTANFKSTARELGFASNGHSGLKTLTDLKEGGFAVAQACLQIAVVRLEDICKFVKAVIDLPLTQAPVGGEILDFRVWCRRAYQTSHAMLVEKNLPPETNFYIQRIGASSSESDPFKRENCQLKMVEGQWKSTSESCMLFRKLADLDFIKDNSVRIVGVAPLSDRKNGFRLEAAMCIHFRACSLFGSMFANVTMGGPHDMVSFWPNPSLPTKQSHAMDAVRALFNDTSVLELDNTNVSEYLG